MPAKRPRRPRAWYSAYEVRVHERTIPRLGRTVRHMSVRKRSGKAGITWDMLQRIKNDILGEDTLCIEVYPPAGQVVNEMNMRHLWEYPDCPINMHKLYGYSDDVEG